MNRTTFLLGATTLVFGSASAYLYSDLRESRTQAAVLQTRVEQLERRATGRVASRPAEGGNLPTSPFNSSSAGATPGPPPRASSTSPTTSAATRASGFSAYPAAVVTNGGMLAGPTFAGWERSHKLLEDPEYRDAMKRQQKMMLPRMYPDLSTAMQLDEEQATQLLDVLAEQQIRSMTNRPPFTPGEAPDEAAMRDWQAQQQRILADNEAEIAAVLGEEKAQQWKNYQSTLGARSQIRELRSNLESAGLPLPADQTEKLVAAVATEQQRSLADAQNSRHPAPANPTALFERQIELTRQHQLRTRTTAAPYLSSAQLEYLERMHADQLEMQEVNLKMMRAQAEAEARGDLPPFNQSVQGGMIVGR
jgi:hypothetical protein